MRIAEIKVTTVRETAAEIGTVTRAEDIRSLWESGVSRCAWYDEEKEAMVVFLLDTKNRVKAFALVSLGTLNASLVTPREVFRPAVLAAANAVIVAHNHPSGNPAPSAEDLQITRTLENAGEILGIKLVDHIIVAEAGKFSSLRAMGHLG